MRNPKAWLFGVVVLAGVLSSTFLGNAPTNAQVPVAAPGGSYWQYHDNRWSHWDNDDRRWYYTDGQHWFANSGKAWEPYRFDRKFGREFRRDKYVYPAQGTTVVVPSHSVYIP